MYIKYLNLKRYNTVRCFLVYSEIEQERRAFFHNFNNCKKVLYFIYIKDRKI